MEQNQPTQQPEIKVDNQTRQQYSTIVLKELFK